MLKIKSLTECTFEQGLAVWNDGFRGYFVEMNMDMDRYLGRIAMEGLSPALSVVAFDGERPVGFVVSGIRTVDGRRIAWNGGTGVVPDYRGKGVGKALIQASLDVYRREGVQFALLEAISKNEPAIQLYEKMGYQIVDRVAFLQREGPMTDITALDDLNQYVSVRGIPHDALDVPFYQKLTAWQTQWQSVHDGESIKLYDDSGNVVGYAVYKRNFDASGHTSAIALYQSETKPGHPDALRIQTAMLSQVYGPLELACRRLTVNISLSNQPLVDALTVLGFTTLSEQVFMLREMEGRGHDVAESV